MKIDLGQKMEPMDDREDGEMWYPFLEVRTDKKIDDVPDEGEATIYFKKKRMSIEDTEDGKEYSCTLEVHSIKDIKEMKKSEEEESMTEEDYVDSELDKEMEDE